MGDDIQKDDELLELFLDESREHLDGIESDLLAIEENGEDIDSDLVNKVFRAVHSVKGAAGFFGLDKVKNLSHAMENILGLIRKEELIPSPQIVTLLLDGADELVGMINKPDTMEDVDISCKVKKLKEIISNSIPEEKQKTIEEKIEIKAPNGHTIFTVSGFELEEAKKSQNGGEFVYLLEYDLIKDIEQQSKDPYKVISELLELTALIDSKIDVEAVSNLGDFSYSSGIPFYVLLASIMKPDIIHSLLDIDEKRIHVIQRGSDVDEEYTATRKAEGKNTAPEKTNDLPKPKTPEKEQASAATPTKTSIPLEKVKEAPPPEKTKEIPHKEPAERKVEVRKPADKKSAKKGKEDKVSTPKGTGSVRVNITLLDTLMTLAGELVLTRNQLIQSVGDENIFQIEKVAQRVDQITTELQDAIMSTRMQSIDIVFHKFRRVVRDLSKELDKNINLILEGEEVELDKTIIESINDPLTHLVRNSIDHGIETPAVRSAKGKPEEGKLKLSAFHKAGQVVIGIQDDGNGIDPQRIKEKAQSMGLYSAEQLNAMDEQSIIKLIFAPGFSTAEVVTDVSGRGVGMDVVNANITKLGGVIDIDSVLGKGTDITIKLPLTLTIIPCLMISEEGEQFAIPQVNLLELQRIAACDVREKIEKIGDVNVMRRRGELLPLIRLRDLLEIKDRTFLHPETGKRMDDRRSSIVDLRFSEEGAEDLDSITEVVELDEENPDARSRSAVNIAIVAAGDFHYGIIVEGLQESSEIVVKPLGCHLRDCRAYAGATILGDGRAALILDVMSIGQMIRNAATSEIKNVETERERQSISKSEDSQTLLVVENAEDDFFAVPLGLVERIEKIHISQVMTIGGQRTMKHREESLLLFAIEDAANVAPRKETERLYVIIYRMAGREIGLMVSNLVDTIESDSKIDEETHVQPGILGSVLINDNITLMVDPQSIVSHVMPEFVAKNSKFSALATKEEQTVLIVEDSKFFLSKIKSFIEEAGYRTLTAQHGIEALEVLENSDENVNLVLTDIEMPELDGYGLSQRIRDDARFCNIPIVAVTSVVGEAAEARGREVGIDEYLAKLDREQIVERSEFFMKHGRAS